MLCILTVNVMSPRSVYSKRSLLKMYVETYETSSSMDFVFQNALYCHVCDRSLYVISY